MEFLSAPVVQKAGDCPGPFFAQTREVRSGLLRRTVENLNDLLARLC